MSDSKPKGLHPSNALRPKIAFYIKAALKVKSDSALGGAVLLLARLSRSPDRMLKQRLIACAWLIVIFISIYGTLELTFHAQPIQSTPSTTVATTASSAPSILSASTTPSLQPTRQPIQSASSTTAGTTASSAPSILSASTTPSLQPTPEPAPSTPTATVGPTPTSKPLKSRVIKHQPSQFRTGALSKEELSVIKKAIRTIQWSRNSDPKAAADEDYAAIVKECEKSNVHDLLADLITEAASNAYQPDNEAANTTYINDLISDFETGLKDEGEGQKTGAQRK